MIRVLRDDGWAEQLSRRLPPGADDIEQWMQQHTQVMKHDTHSCVGLLEIESDLCYLKLYHSKSPIQSLGFQLGYGRGVRSFDAAVRLASAGVAVPAARCVLLVPGGMLLLTEGLANSVDLKALWLQQSPGDNFSRWMAPAGKAMAKLHLAGFSHGDCKWSNFQCCESGVLFVDLEAVRRSAPGGAAQSRDLARFILNAEDMALPRKDYELFIDAYLAATRQNRDELLAGVLKQLKPLRGKHVAKYGQRGHSLV
jgi:tRNA A-37 threonylcarbamoyl transferase component Bud32